MAILCCAAKNSLRGTGGLCQLSLQLFRGGGREEGVPIFPYSHIPEFPYLHNQEVMVLGDIVGGELQQLFLSWETEPCLGLCCSGSFRRTLLS